jgi:hypothetical protein
MRPRQASLAAAAATGGLRQAHGARRTRRASCEPALPAPAAPAPAAHGQVAPAGAIVIILAADGDRRKRSQICRRCHTAVTGEFLS